MPDAPGSVRTPPFRRKQTGAYSGNRKNKGGNELVKDRIGEFGKGIVGVVGGSSAGPEILAMAEDLGAGVARMGCILVTGGGGGVMRAASRGAFLAGGLVIGILPNHRGQAMEGYPNEYVHVPVFTGMSDARNAIIARTAEVIVAMKGSLGTISEVALALKAGTPVVSLACPQYDLFASSPGYLRAQTVREVLEKLEEMLVSPRKQVTKQ